jgi:hypothetical protein
VGIEYTYGQICIYTHIFDHVYTQYIYIYIYIYIEYSVNSKSSTLEPYQPQHDLPAAWVIAQQYFSPTISLPFYTHKGRFIIFENVTVLSLLLFYDEGPRLLSRYSDWLRIGRPGDGIRVEGETFGTRPDRPWGPPSLLYSRYRVSFPGVKRPGRGVNQPHPSSAKVKETVELYHHFPSETSWPVVG